MTEYERFGLVFTKTRVYKFGHRILSLSLLSIAHIRARYLSAQIAELGIWILLFLAHPDPSLYCSDPDPDSSIIK
jgi:hypothetical protein